MKNKLLAFLLLIFMFSSLMSGCIPGEKNPGDTGLLVPKIDNSTDLVTYTDENMGEEEQFYTSKKLSFVSSINGFYSVDKPFTLDKSDDSKRIYDDIYLYIDDYFYMDMADSFNIYCNLSDDSDSEYATIYKEQNTDIYVLIKKQGIYKIVFDLKTMSFDMEYKAEITTPVYPEIKNVDMATVVDKNVIYTTMTKAENSDEFLLENVNIQIGQSVYFNNYFTHTSTYKITLKENIDKKYAVVEGKNLKYVKFYIGGNYNIYLNAKTYEVNIVLNNINDATYFCQTYYNDEYIVITNSAENPYVFNYEYTATEDIGGYGVHSDDIPKFYTKSYQKYDLAVTDSSLISKSEYKGALTYYFKKTGTYIITIDLSNFTISVSLKP